MGPAFGASVPGPSTKPESASVDPPPPPFPPTPPEVEDPSVVVEPPAPELPVLVEESPPLLPTAGEPPPAVVSVETAFFSIRRISVSPAHREERGLDRNDG